MNNFSINFIKSALFVSSILIVGCSTEPQAESEPAKEKYIGTYNTVYIMDYYSAWCEFHDTSIVDVIVTKGSIENSVIIFGSQVLIEANNFGYVNLGPENYMLVNFFASSISIHIADGSYTHRYNGSRM